MIKFSVVTTSFNEEKKIEDCFESIKDLADEIILVDGGSTDKTLEISRKYTDKIFTRSNNPMLNVNKNYGFSKATGEWILSLDADERVTTELAGEIKEKIVNCKLKIGNSVNGYWIPRKNIIFGKWIEHTGWYPDHQMRLFKNGKGKFEEKHVHEMIKIAGSTDYLKSDLLHYNYSTIIQFINKLNIYIPNEAEQLVENGYKFKWQDTIRFPIKEFLSRFFAREGYKDGLHGLVLSMLMASYHLFVIASIWEKTGFEKIENKTFNGEVNEELEKSYKDLSFWIDNARIKSLKNPFQKMAYKIFRKIHVK